MVSRHNDELKMVHRDGRSGDATLSALSALRARRRRVLGADAVDELLALVHRLLGDLHGRRRLQGAGMRGMGGGPGVSAPPQAGARFRHFFRGRTYESAAELADDLGRDGVAGLLARDKEVEPAELLLELAQMVANLLAGL